MATIKYKQIKNFIKKNELNVFQKYCYNKLDQNINYELDYKNFSPIFNNDCLADSLLDNKLKDIESITNIRLFPTYANLIYNVFGNYFEQLKNRPANEITAKICIKKYDDWIIEIDKKLFNLDEGDVLIYSGTNHKYSRNKVYKGEGIAEINLHYVNQDGIYKEHAYDQIFKKDVPAKIWLDNLLKVNNE